MCVLFAAASCLKGELSSCSRECGPPAKPKIFTVWPFAEKVYEPLLYHAPPYSPQIFAHSSLCDGLGCDFLDVLAGSQRGF